MSTVMDALRDLEILIDSRYPILAIESHEEERVEAILERLAARMSLPLYTWTVTEGLRRAGTPHAIYETLKPSAALANIGAMHCEGIYLLKGLQRDLEGDEIVRKLQDLARGFATRRRALVLTAPAIE